MNKYLLVVIIAVVPSCLYAQNYDAGMRAFENKDYATALAEWTPLVEQGNAAAQYRLGILFTNGWGVKRNDATAFELWLKSAEQGNADAQNAVGSSYDNGFLAAPNDEIAVDWYRKSAQQGHVHGQRHLAQMYERGEGVTRDLVRAHMWYSLASAGGFPIDLESLEQIMAPAQLLEARNNARLCSESNFQGCE